MTSVPFVIGQWVYGPRFYGRQGLIDEILTGPRNALWLLGTRRVGKTSLLKHLEHLATTDRESSFFPLFWDLQGCEDPDEMHAGFADALLDAEERLERLGVRHAEVKADDLFICMGNLRRKLLPKGQRLLLLCDEVEELIRLQRKDAALLRKLRHAMQASGDMRSVLASTIRLWALADQRDDTSPFLHGFTPPLYIGPMSSDAARALIRQEHLPAESRPHFAEEDIETLRRRCGNHPYLLQLVSKRLLECGDLEEAAAGVAADPMVAHFFSVDYKMLQPVERQVLRAIAHDPQASIDSLETRLAVETPTLQTALHNLRYLGFIRLGADRRVATSNDFFRRWITETPASDGRLLGQSSARSGSTDRSSPETTLEEPCARSILDDRYELLREAGEGATGSVYEAWDHLLETRIAVKLLRPEYSGNRLVLERFRQEILLSRDLAHPNIVRVYHLGQFNGRTYLTMQWIDGITLAETIAAEAPLAAERIAFIGARLASALESAHGHGVLHRDLKPENIMLDRAGEPLITDFGLARLMEGPGVTTHGIFLGTPNYVSPEQARMETLDQRSDLYSLGVVLFEMATGHCPFQGDDAAEVLEKHRDLAPPDPREVEPAVTPELSEIILSCLIKDRDSRIASAAELRQRLEGLLPEGGSAGHASIAVSRQSAGEASGLADPTSSRARERHRARYSAEDLLPLVYDELRRLARGFLARERPDHTLQPTALVHEAYLRLAGQDAVDWAGRTHFLSVGATVMRRLLVDHARSRRRQKRGGAMHKVTLQEAITPDGRHDLGCDELLTLDVALDELAAIDKRQALVIELRFFCGMTVEEAAEHLGVSKRTVEADWTAARTWLRQRLAT